VHRRNDHLTSFHPVVLSDLFLPIGVIVFPSFSSSLSTPANKTIWNTIPRDYHPLYLQQGPIGQIFTILLFSMEREAIFANRDNSDFKWQRSKYVVGALVVQSEPVFNPREDMIPRYKDGCNDTFAQALQEWDDTKLRQAFIDACDDLPAESCCCGLIHDEDASIKGYVKLLNEKWVKNIANKKLQPRGFKIE
jgi:hypothetical protein